MGESLMMKLGLDPADFERGLGASEAGLAGLQETAKMTAAQLALLAQEMKGKGSDGKGTQEQIAQYKAMELSLRDTRKEAIEMKKHLDALEAVKSKQSPSKPTPQGVRQETDEPPRHAGQNKAEMAHSVRSFLDMFAAGQSPLQALQMEAPRAAQAMGASIGTLIGIGIAGVLAKKLASMVEENGETKVRQQHSLRGGPSQGVESAEQDRGRVNELNASIEEVRPKLTMLGKFGQLVSDAATSFVTDLSQVLRGKKGLSDDATHPEDQRAILLKEQLAAREKYIGQIVADAKLKNDFKDDAFERGEARAKPAAIERERQHAVAGIEDDLGIPDAKAEIDRITKEPNIWDADKQKQLKQLQEELNVKVKEAEALQAQANRQFDLEAKKAVLQTQEEMYRRDAVRDETFITHPGIDASASNSSQEEVANPNGKEFHTPLGMLASHPVAAADANYTAAMGRLNAAREAHKDDRREADDALQAEARLHDAAIARAQMKPEDQNAADRAQLRHDQLDVRLGHPGTRSADREGGTANNADKTGSMIPDASEGHGATEAYENDTNAAFQRRFSAQDMHALPNRIPDIQAGAETAAAKAQGGFNDANIVAAQDRTTAAVARLSFQNKK